jgi:hypothetical protein
MNPRDLYIQALRSMIGAPYLWGGSDLNGTDCSGCVCYCLKAAGFNIPQKLDAEQIAVLFHPNKVIYGPKMLPGTLLFYGDNAAAVDHVMSVLAVWPNGGACISGARGGTHLTTSPDVAMAQNAYVAVVFGNTKVGEFYWPSRFQFALDPFRS